MPRLKPAAKRAVNDLAGRPFALYVRVSEIDRKKIDRKKDESIREKSSDDQEAVGRAWAQRSGAAVVDLYGDPGVCASRFTTKERKEFNRLLADLKAGRYDGGGLWFWELSRS